MSDTVIPFHTLGADDKVQTKYTHTINKLRETFMSGHTKSVKWRIEQLKNMKRFLEENTDALLEAMDKDLGKKRMEGLLFDIELTINEIRACLLEIHDWVKPEKTEKNLLSIFDGVYIWNEPFGVCLVMGAWNYPIQLLLCPAVGAIAAGNAVVMKTSDLAPATASVLEKLNNYLDPDALVVIPGGIPESAELLKERFDHIFYTGSIVGGKIVYSAAQKYLTPVVLELGGKSPVYIDTNVDLPIATRRICWGKWVNAGQTCVAPDHVFVPESIYEDFIQECQDVVKEFYGENPKQAKDFGRIVTSRHTKRLQNLIQGANVVFGGVIDTEERYVAPTVLRDVKMSDPIMREEIFGPILPVIKVKDLTEAIELIQSRDKPLTAYIFSKDQEVIDRFIEQTSAGSICVNDLLLQLAVDSLPFGGTGHSGMGRYHGKHSFDCFSNKKAILQRDFNPVGEFLGKQRYPPHFSIGIEIFRQIMYRRRNPINFALNSAPYALGASVGIIGTIFFQLLGF